MKNKSEITYEYNENCALTKCNTYQNDTLISECTDEYNDDGTASKITTNEFGKKTIQEFFYPDTNTTIRRVSITNNETEEVEKYEVRDMRIPEIKTRLVFNNNKIIESYTYRDDEFMKPLSTTLLRNGEIIIHTFKYDANGKLLSEYVNGVEETIFNENNNNEEENKSGKYLPKITEENYEDGRTKSIITEYDNEKSTKIIRNYDYSDNRETIIEETYQNNIKVYSNKMVTFREGNKKTVITNDTHVTETYYNEHWLISRVVKYDI